jgi:hypothetical protein
MKIILVVCGFSRDIRVVYASLLFMRFWLFVLSLSFDSLSFEGYS